MGTKNLYENEPNPFFFFFFFSILWQQEWSRFVLSNPFEHFVTRLQTDLVDDSYGNEKTYTKMGQIRFFFFFNLMATRMVQIRIVKFV